jgi:DNA-binding NarL/FixJ family response regulator
MTARKSASVAVVDDHALIRRGFGSSISGEEGLIVVWTASSIVETMEKLQSSVPEVMVIDLVLEDGSGLDLVRSVKEKHPLINILVSSMQDEKLYASRCMKAGASGFIAKSEPLEKLIEAIHVIAEGEVYLSDAMANYMRLCADPKTGAEGIDRLSDRELQVLELIGKGMDTKRIAKDMDISPKTVDSFRERIKSKLQLSNSTELVHYAVTRMV